MLSSLVKVAAAANGTEMDAAQFAAGFLFGTSGRSLDKRDYIVSCFAEQEGLIAMVDDVMQKLSDGDRLAALKAMNSDQFAHKYVAGMKACDETRDAYVSVINDGKSFFKRADHKDIAKTNYEANKAFVDLETENAVRQWSIGVYFDAGMFLGEDWATITDVSAAPAPPAPVDPVDPVEPVDPEQPSEDQDSAHFLAGFLLALSGGHVDKKSELVQCIKKEDKLISLIDQAMKDMSEGHNHDALKVFISQQFRKEVVTALKDCTHIDEMAAAVFAKGHDFFEREDYRQVLKDNYLKHKDLIDQDTAAAVLNWTRNHYHQAGYFFGRDWVHVIFGKDDDKPAKPEGRDEAAQWAAGYLFGVSGRLMDKRAELEQCFEYQDGLQELIDSGMEKLQKHDWSGAHDVFASHQYISKFTKGMANCEEVGKVYQKVNKRALAFKARDDAKDIMKANYDAHKAFIDKDFNNSVTQWMNGVYFDAAMFLGEDIATLTVVPQDDVQIAPIFSGADAPVVEDDAAQYVAGYLYGITGRVTDMRAETLACFTPQDGLVDIIDQGMEKMAAGDYKGMSEVFSSTDYTSKMSAGMAACDEVNAAYEPINKYAQDFYARDDAKDLLKSNYQSHKDFIDLEAQRAVTSWTLGVYFNAGMFLGEDVAALTVLPQ